MIFDEMKYGHITHIFIIAIAALLLCFSSCHNNNNKHQKNDDNQIMFETVELNMVYHLENNSNYPSCNLDINISYPIESSLYSLDKIQNVFNNVLLGSGFEDINIEEAIEKYSQNYIDNYEKDAEIYKTSKPKEDYGEYDDGEHSNMPEIFYSYYETITDTIVYNHYGVLSFQIIQTNSKGGYTFHESVKNYVVDLVSGEMLNEGDIFLAGYDVALRPIIQNCFMQQNGVKSINDLEDLGYFGIDEIIPNKNFLITEEGIVYTYNKGEYSAYQLPISEILIPYSFVRSILKEGSIANKLSQLQ